MRVQACWASNQRQLLRDLELPDGSAIAAALDVLHASLLRDDPVLAASIDWQRAAVGVRGQLRTRDARLRDGDRLEIHRPLQLDPKEGRRQRAQRLRKRQGG